MPLQTQDLPKTTKYSCGVCSKSFKDKEALHQHLPLHIEKTFKCGICYKLFSDKDDCRGHEDKHTETPPVSTTLPQPPSPHSCDLCSKSYSDKHKLKRHFQTHHTTNEPFSCRICSKSFGDSANYKLHKKTHKKPSTQSCDICYKSFGCKSILKVHMRSHTGERPFQCDLCSKSFMTPGHLKRHIGTHTGEKPFKCDLCSKSFMTPGHLKKHVGTHTGESPFKCDLCSKSFMTPGNLKRHMRSHTGEKPFKCGICSKSFAQKSYCLLHEERHLKKNHDPANACYFCGYTAVDKWILETHLRTHTGEKPFNCEICCKSFSCHTGRAFHKRSHPQFLLYLYNSLNPSSNKLKTYPCYFCTKLSRNQSSLEIHMGSHTGERPFRSTCEFCSKSFTNPILFTRHKKIHSEYILRLPQNPYKKLKIYSCYFCGKYIPTKSDLEVHLRGHTGEKPFKCGICLMESAQSGIYSRHAKIHNIKPSEVCSLLNRTF